MISLNAMDGLTHSSTNLINQPLPIDFIRKLKRPNTIPSTLEYTNGTSFQGTHLEDWLMQSLDEYILNTSVGQSQTSQNFLNCVNKQLKDSLHKSGQYLRSPSANTEAEEVVNEEIMISYQVASKGDHSMPGTQEVTPAPSITTSVTSLNMEHGGKISFIFLFIIVFYTL